MSDGSHIAGRWRGSGTGLARALAVALCAVLGGMGTPARGDTLSREQVALFDRGLQAFDRGAQVRQSNPVEAREAFRESAAAFQSLVNAGIRNGKLYYNLGNAYLLGGQLGEAILNYRRAERLIPRDPRLAENLRYARSLCPDQIPASGRRAFLATLFFWHGNTSTRARFAAAIGAYVLFWLLLVIYVLTRRKFWLSGALPALLVWVALGISVGIDLYGDESRAGVLLADEVTVRKGNGEGFEPQFEQKLHAGVEFTILEQRGDWLWIELADGKSGWVKAAEAGLI